MPLDGAAEEHAESALDADTQLLELLQLELVLGAQVRHVEQQPVTVAAACRRFARTACWRARRAFAVFSSAEGCPVAPAVLAVASVVVAAPIECCSFHSRLATEELTVSSDAGFDSNTEDDVEEAGACEPDDTGTERAFVCGELSAATVGTAAVAGTGAAAAAGAAVGAPAPARMGCADSDWARSRGRQELGSGIECAAANARMSSSSRDASDMMASRSCAPRLSACRMRRKLL